MSIHACSAYKVQYASGRIHGYDEIGKFINFLRDKQDEVDDGIFINENETSIEIDFDVLEQLKDDETWGEKIKEIINDADKSNGYARLEIF